MLMAMVWVKRFQKFGKNKCNRDYIIAMRELSHSVYQAGIDAPEKSHRDTG